MATKAILLGVSLIILVGVIMLSLSPDRAAGRDAPSAQGTAVRDTIERMHESMAQAIMGKSPGQYFAATMIPYCRAGQELSKKIGFLKPDAGLEKLAVEMDASDTSLLEAMRSWQEAGHTQSLQLGENSRKSFVRLMHEVKTSAWQDMEPALSDMGPERSYITILIVHNQGAIDMAKVLLIFESDDELRRLAGRIISEKQAEIRSMQAWLRGQ